MAVTRAEFEQYQQIAKDYLERAGIVITDEEAERLEIADLGLGEYEQTGLGPFPRTLRKGSAGCPSPSPLAGRDLGRGKQTRAKSAKIVN
ncbi:MAG: hypothetical protein EHM39_08655 [Chloroflexi bacterium]|nr:MAG: hypothetical protein EHM39_08655 [Chloroflexota bacterium]